MMFITRLKIKSLQEKIRKLEEKIEMDCRVDYLYHCKFDPDWSFTGDWADDKEIGSLYLQIEKMLPDPKW